LLHRFFDNLDSTIYRLVNESYQVLGKQINKKSVLYQLQNIKGQARWDALIDSLTPNFGAQSTDIKMVEVVYRMMLNTTGSTSELIRLVGPITQDLYQSESVDIIMFVKGLLMKIEPWKPNWEDRLKKLFATFDDTLNQLYGIVVGFTG
jgi:hypothetical protein